MLSRSADVEFVHDISAKLPNQVVGELVGIPKQDWGQINIWAEQSTSSQDPDLGTGYAPTECRTMAIYAMEFAARRRAEPPREDLATLLLSGKLWRRADDRDWNSGASSSQLVTAGNDTTKTMLSSGLHALLAHPDQLQALRDDPSRLPDAVEEILRYANPLHYFRRNGDAGHRAQRNTYQGGRKGRHVLHPRPTGTRTSSSVPRSSTSPGIRIRTCRSGSVTTSV